MRFNGHGWCALALLFLAGAAGAAPQQDTTHAGELVYQRSCAMCHDHGEALRAPTLATLKGMRYQQVYYALTVGKMQAQGQTLSPTDRSELIDYLIGRARVSDAWTAQLRCRVARRKVDLSMPATVAGFGFDLHNHRHLTAQQAGITTADFRHMELAWALAFPRATTMRAQAAVVGSTLFLPVADASQLYAIEIAERPCLKWIYKSDVPLRTGVGYGVLPGSHRKVLVFADVGTRIHMVDAATGAPLWQQAVHPTSLSNTTGTPVLLGERVYVPLSASEINVGADANHLCCTTHGAVIRTAQTMPDAKPIRDRGDGQMMWGPSGAPIWTSPASDEKRGVLYVGTGEATSAPAAPTTDSVLAIELATGAIRWRFQATADDVFLTGCMVKHDGLNCPHEGRLLDHDFGAPTVIDGAVVEGSADGFLRAFDANTGELLFQFDTTQPLATANGVPGSGGALDNASILAARGYLFVNSGYGIIGGQTPGNLFLAFHAKAH